MANANGKSTDLLLEAVLTALEERAVDIASSGALELDPGATHIAPIPNGLIGLYNLMDVYVRRSLERPRTHEGLIQRLEAERKASAVRELFYAALNDAVPESQGFQKVSIRGGNVYGVGQVPYEPMHIGIIDALQSAMASTTGSEGIGQKPAEGTKCLGPMPNWYAHLESVATRLSCESQVLAHAAKALHAVAHDSIHTHLDGKLPEGQCPVDGDDGNLYCEPEDHNHDSDGFSGLGAILSAIFGGRMSGGSGMSIHVLRPGDDKKNWL